MAKMRIHNALKGWFRKPLSSEQCGEARVRGPRTHVIILDGTLSTLEPGYETHAGVTYRLLQEMGGQMSLFYESGMQWPRLRDMLDVIMGRGIDDQIRRAYGFLASRYRPGDKIFLMGYSRGAYAVRSLAGVLEMVGLVKAEHAATRHVNAAYRYYRCNPRSPHARAFRKAYCHDDVPIEMIGVWDTVKALGLRLPLAWRVADLQHSYHNHHLGESVKNGFHALALNETRQVYEPVLWGCPGTWPGRIQQVWFKGSHGDIGGQLGGFGPARPLSNLSLVWMLERAESVGMPLPEGWKKRFETDVSAPSVGTWRTWGKLFLFRRPRKVGRDRSEKLHTTVKPEDVPKGAAPLDHIFAEMPQSRVDS